MDFPKMSFPVFEAKRKITSEWVKDSPILEEIVNDSKDYIQKLGNIGAFSDVSEIANAHTRGVLTQSKQAISEHDQKHAPHLSAGSVFDEDANAFLAMATDKASLGVNIAEKYESLADAKTEKKADRFQAETLDLIYARNLAWVREAEPSIHGLDNAVHSAVKSVAGSLVQRFKKAALEEDKKELARATHTYSQLFADINPRYKDLANKRLERYSAFIADADDLDKGLEAAKDIPGFPEKGWLMARKKAVQTLEKRYKGAEKQHKPWFIDRQLYSCQQNIDALRAFGSELGYAIDNYEHLVLLRGSIGEAKEQILGYISKLPSLAASKEDIRNLAAIRDYAEQSISVPDNPLARSMLGDDFSEYQNLLSQLRQDVKTKIEENPGFEAEYREIIAPVPSEPETFAPDRFHIGIYLSQFKPESEEYRIWSDILLGKFQDSTLMERVEHLQRRVKSGIMAEEFAANPADIEYIGHIKHGLERFSQNGYLGDVIRDFEHRQQKVKDTLGLLDQFLERSKMGYAA